MAKKHKIISVLVFNIFLFLSLIIYTSVLWSNRTFGRVEMNQLLFTLLAPKTNMDQEIIVSWILESFIISIFITLIVLIGYCLIIRYWKNKLNKPKILYIINKYIWVLGISLLVVSLFIAENNFKVIDYLNTHNQETDIYKSEKPSIKKKKL